MKKLLTFFALILSLLTFSSCSKQDKIVLERYTNIESAIDLYATSKEHPSLKLKKENKDSFLLYGYLPTCSTCAVFSEVYDNYVKENKVVLYKSTVSDVMVLEEKAPIKAPYLAIYRDGEMSEIFTYSKHKSIFTNLEDFDKLINKYFTVGDFTYMQPIFEKELDKKIKNNEQFIVYFGWNKCGDCTFMHEVYLNDFLKKNDKNFYYFETDRYRLGKDPSEEEIKNWNDFTNKYKFGEYRNGKVPSLVYFSEGKPIDFLVYLNDELEFKDKSVIVKSSYYKDNPHLNKEFSGNSVMEAYDNYKNTCKDFYNSKLDEFFNKYLK